MSGGIATIDMLDKETQEYYWKVSKGQIEERSYESWGPESAEEEAYWKQWWWQLPCRVPFNRISWDSGFTGRGIRRTKKKHMERLDLIGPKGEILDLDTGTINPDKPVKKPKRAANSDLPRKSKMRKLAHVLKEPWGI